MNDVVTQMTRSYANFFVMAMPGHFKETKFCEERTTYLNFLSFLNKNTINDWTFSKVIAILIH